MHQPISFEKIDTEEKWKAMVEFARSFNHRIDDSTLTPLIAVRRGSKLFGYIATPKYTVIFPAFHPKLTAPRDFIDAVEAIRSWAWLSTTGQPRYPSGVCCTAFDIGSHVEEPLRKLGFRATGTQLWESYPELMEESK